MVTHRVARKRWRKVVLAVTDQKNSVRYFIDVLGFQPEWRDENIGRQLPAMACG